MQQQQQEQQQQVVMLDVLQHNLQHPDACAVSEDSIMQDQHAAVALLQRICVQAMLLHLQTANWLGGAFSPHTTHPHAAADKPCVTFSCCIGRVLISSATCCIACLSSGIPSWECKETLPTNSD
jgi:hypothetical protein